MFIKKSLLLLLPAVFLFAACGEDEYEDTPVDKLITQMDAKKDFTIILYDMDVDDTGLNTYKHRYKIITEKDSLVGKAGTELPAPTNGAVLPAGAPATITLAKDSFMTVPVVEYTGWNEVDEEFFKYHQDDIGMEIASKENGKVTKETSPPGYSRHVGNSQYGHWNNSNGTSFWEFYGQYAFMRSMLGMYSTPIYHTGFIDYRQNYYGNRPYYGTSVGGVRQYGTGSALSQQQNPGFHQRSMTNNNLKSRVQESVSRSQSGKSSRSSNRYSGSSSSRSRSGSYGK